MKCRLPYNWENWNRWAEIEWFRILKLRHMCFLLIFAHFYFAQKHSETCMLSLILNMGWAGSPEMDHLWGKCFQSQLNCALSKHWAVQPLCFTWFLRARRYLPAISCADRLGTKPLSIRGNGRTGWIRLVIWEDYVGHTRHLPNTSPGYLKTNLCVVQWAKWELHTEDKGLFIYLRLNFSAGPSK